MRHRPVATLLLFACIACLPVLIAPPAHAGRIRDLAASANGGNVCIVNGANSCLCPNSTATPFLAQLDGTQYSPSDCTPGSDKNQPNPPLPYPNRTVVLSTSTFTVTITPVLWEFGTFPATTKYTIFQVQFRGQSGMTLRSLVIGNVLANPRYVVCDNNPLGGGCGSSAGGTCPYCTPVTTYADSQQQQAQALEPTAVTLADNSTTRWDFYQFTPGNSVALVVQGFPAEFQDIDNTPQSNSLSPASFSPSNFLAIVDNNGTTVRAGGLRLTSAPAAPNDLVGSAIAIHGFPFSSVVDTTATNPQEMLPGGQEINPQGDPAPSCSADPSRVFRSVWYTFTAGNDLPIEITTQGSRYDTLVYVFSGPNSVACDDDRPQSGIGAVESDLTFTPTPHQQYTIMVSETPPDELFDGNGNPSYIPLSNDATLVLKMAHVKTPTASQFTAVTPCRIVDTRDPNGGFGGPILAGTQRDFPLPTGPCAIPSGVTAYSLNVTVVPHGPLQYLTVWPTGQQQPVVSTLNSDGRVKANAAIVAAGTNEAVSVYATNTTDLILDIDGYFTNTSTLFFYPVTPCRLVDTRSPDGQLGGPYLQAGAARNFPLQENPCLNAVAEQSMNPQAYSLNFTAIPHGSLEYLSVWPAGQSQPVVSTLNASTGTVTANAAIVVAGTGGDIDVLASDDSDVVIDINGYFASQTSPPSGLSLYTRPPCRTLDTRQGTGAFNGLLQPPVDVVDGPCAPPNTAQAFVMNATVVPPGALTYLTLWADGDVQPMVSTLNATDGAVTSNMAVVPTVNGLINAYASDRTQLILDLSGYFAP